MRDSYTDKTLLVQHYTTQICALRESGERYSKLLDASHNGGCCRKCNRADITRFGIVRCKIKKKVVNGLAICENYDGELNEKI